MARQPYVSCCFAAVAWVALLLAQPASATQHASLVVLTLDDCRFCARLMAEQIVPLKRGPAKSWLKILTTDLRGNRLITLAGGKRTSGAELARLANSKVAPTVVFLDAAGNFAAPPLIGYSSPDFYGAYLDERLQTLAHTGGRHPGGSSTIKINKEEGK
ncbi:MAG: hypothetical protein KF778_17630 [Rhodocyclaceae bacterium]|nr:hypothetical protein [Rhodocyclaceae bacterium]